MEAIIILMILFGYMGVCLAALVIVVFVIKTLNAELYRKLVNAFEKWGEE